MKLLTPSKTTRDPSAPALAGRLLGKLLQRPFWFRNGGFFGSAHQSPEDITPVADAKIGFAQPKLEDPLVVVIFDLHVERRTAAEPAPGDEVVRLLRLFLGPLLLVRFLFT